MNTRSNAMSGSPIASQVAATVSISASQRFYWPVRRELWENRSIYIAPLAVAGTALFAFCQFVCGHLGSAAAARPGASSTTTSTWRLV